MDDRNRAHIDATRGNRIEELDADCAALIRDGWTTEDAVLGVCEGSELTVDEEAELRRRFGLVSP